MEEAAGFSTKTGYAPRGADYRAGTLPSIAYFLTNPVRAAFDLVRSSRPCADPCTRPHLLADNIAHSGSPGCRPKKLLILSLPARSRQCATNRQAACSLGPTRACSVTARKAAMVQPPHNTASPRIFAPLRAKESESQCAACFFFKEVVSFPEVVTSGTRDSQLRASLPPGCTPGFYRWLHMFGTPRRSTGSPTSESSVQTRPGPVSASLLQCKQSSWCRPMPHPAGARHNS